MMSVSYSNSAARTICSTASNKSVSCLEMDELLALQAESNALMDTISKNMEEMGL